MTWSQCSEHWLFGSLQLVVHKRPHRRSTDCIAGSALWRRFLAATFTLAGLIPTRVHFLIKSSLFAKCERSPRLWCGSSKVFLPFEGEPKCKIKLNTKKGGEQGAMRRYSHFLNVTISETRRFSFFVLFLTA